MFSAFDYMSPDNLRSPKKKKVLLKNLLLLRKFVINQLKNLYLNQLKNLHLRNQ